MWTYITLIMGFVFEPLDALIFQYFTPVSVFWKGALIFFPFMLLAAYILFLSLRGTMQHNLRMIFTRKYWKKTWKNPKSRRKMAIFPIVIVIITIHDIWRIMLG